MGGFQRMFSLNLSHNNFSSRLPSELSKLSHLSTLDLSHNYLCGRIPSSFQKLDSLVEVDLSYNNLQGGIPKTPAFMNATLKGNKCLCGNNSGITRDCSAVHTGCHC